jgi:ComF family protein
MLSSWLFPRGKVCAWCGRPLRQGILCRYCRQELQAWEGVYHPCRHCGRLLPVDKEPLCRQCREVIPVFHKARALGPYQGLMKAMVHSLKYQGRRSLAVPLGQLLAGLVLREQNSRRPDLVVPVPLTANRLQTRGFNQAELLARVLAAELGLPLAAAALTRIKETAPQFNLSRQQRWENLSAAFKVAEPDLIKGRCLVLVDDVLTTGATASACTRTMLAAGAATVTVITLATGVED